MSTQHAPEDRTDQFRRVRYHLGRAEDALDIATAALYRAGELTDRGWVQEFNSDLEVLRNKINALHALIR